MTNLVFFLFFWIMAYVKWELSKFLAICYIFTQFLLWKLFMLFSFHLKKDKKYLFINKHNYICDGVKEFLSTTNKIDVLFL